MPEANNTPNWELLPHDPVGFFGLADGFERKDLKRAYNRLLRVFKPEKFPQEFQRIRQAYEQLDEQLRYHGGASRQQVPVPREWKTDAEEVSDTESVSRESAGAAKPQPAPKKLIERIEEESPAALFKELKERPNKTPYEYYALAVLSDIVERKPLGFVKWIVQGVAAHRGDGALKQLLHDYFRGPQDGAALATLLPHVAQAVRTDEFYPLTEPAWQVVLRECDFSLFATTYDRCETELRDSHIVGRMAFLIHLLKSALWKDTDPNGWAARQFAFVEENFDSIPPWLEWDVELLSLAREYQAVRQQFARGSSLRATMDAALKDYFSESQEVGDRSMVAAQMQILAAGDRLMDEFPLEESELLHKFYPIWAWASHDVAERQSISAEQEVNENIWASRAAALLGQLEKQCNNSWNGTAWSACLVGRIVALVVLGFGSLFIGFLLAMLLVLAPLETILGWKAVDQGMIFAGIFAGTCALVIPWLSKSKLDQKVWFPLNGYFAGKCYHKFWRREVLDFQRRSHVPDQFFRAVFAHFADKSATSSWVNHFVQQDFAPAILAGAQRYEA